jgi:hypothetical protein
MPMTKEKNRAYYEANREKVLEKERTYREANREKVLEYKRAYHEANREKIAEQKRAYYEANREKFLEKERKYREANREKVLLSKRTYREANREKVLEKDRTYREANREKFLLRRASERAKKFGREFDIELSDITIPNICPVLNIPLTVGTGKLHAASPALDRIDSSKGYVKGNVRVISHRANTLKSNATLEELRRVYEDALRLATASA